MTPHNQNLKSPLRISQTLICPITPEENELPYDSLESLAFDIRHDFLINDNFAGIAIKINLFNVRAQTFRPTGVRRNITLTISDTSNYYRTLMNKSLYK